MPPRDTVDHLLFGRTPALSAQLARVAAGLFVLSLFAHLAARYLDSVSLTGPLVTAAVVLSMFVVAAGAAYVNDGLLLSIALAAGISVGFYAPAVLFELQNPGEATLWVLVVGSLSALVVGLVGFAAGAGARRFTAE